MPKVYITVGLPASGKSTWAKGMVDKSPNGIKRINKDSLRAMLDNHHHTGQSEKFIVKVRDQLILMALEEGKSVIVDDTNINPIHISTIRDLVKGKGEVVIKDFMGVPFEECIRRDSLREGHEKVGEEVIMRMFKEHKKFNRPANGPAQLKKSICNPNLPKALVVDVDGTLALHVTRGPYDTSRYHEDALNEPVADMVRSWAKKKSYFLVVVSAREQKFDSVTTKWLRDNDIYPDFIFMRKTGDNRRDDIVKEELLMKELLPRFNIMAVIDDRDRVVQMWRKHGIPCFQVADGNF